MDKIENLPNGHMAEFDENPAFQDQIKPALQALKAVCERNGVPLLVGMCLACKPVTEGGNGGWQSAGTVYFNGPERTPDELALARSFIEGGLQAGIACVMGYMQSHGMGAVVGVDNKGDAARALSAALTALGQDPSKAVIRAGFEPDFTGEHAGKRPASTKH